MKKILLIILACIFSFSFGQKKFTINELINSFPLNKATKVKIISYNIDFPGPAPIPPPPIGKDGDSTAIKKFIANQKFPITLENIIGKEDLEGINQNKTLNFKETVEFSKLLYNTCGKFQSGLREVTKCFFPRNAILFYDENDKVFETLEICFECHRMDYHSGKSMEVNYMCDNFYKNLEKYFQSKGLQTKYIRK
ncbi:MULTISPECIES: hypothetical protein [unclassified Chryseobacterium]|uniref:hypothetical protein n=1 Tax=unclassified Chryseobacterium TaxID=2593645 RepID=UPI00226A2979|nr:MULTISPECIES: hypothetical protein [unclassified Chryseobacterium]